MRSDISAKFEELGEYAAAGMFETPERSLFYRRALGVRRYFEHCRLPEYTGTSLYPSGRMDKENAVIPDFMFCFYRKEPAFSLLPQELKDAYSIDFECYQSSVPERHTMAGNMAEHSIPNYERVLKEGLESYVPRIKKMTDPDMRDGLLQLMEGIRTYVARCIALLEKAGAGKQLIDGLRQVPLYPARNIFEAVLSWNFVMYIDGCDNLGCLADGLMPYFKGENIVPLLANLYDNLDINNGYSMALHTNISELTMQCLEASKGKRRPMIELFVDENTSDDVYQKAISVIRTSNGQPAFYNETLFYKGLKEKIPGLTDKDLARLCGSGCTEMEICGCTNVGSVDAGVNLLWILEKSIEEHLLEAESFEDFYRLFMKETKDDVEEVMREISISQKERAKFNPLPLRTLLMDDCIDRSVEFNAGGTRFMWSLISFGGMINVIDSLLVIRDTVFAEKKYTKEEFLQNLKANDEGFLRECRHHVHSFGNDDADANAMANRVSSGIYGLLDGKKPYLGSAFLPCSIMFRSVAIYGRKVGATPDGRPKGAPLCDSLAAIYGKDTKGPAALLKSVTSLALSKAMGTPVLNFSFQPEISDENLTALIRGYLKLGGMQMQLSCVSTELLMDAYEHPDLHRNLVVRVGGYSDYFNNLTDDMKKVIIARSIHGAH